MLWFFLALSLLIRVLPINAGECSFVTLVDEHDDNGGYVDGAVALGYSIQKHHSAPYMIALIDKNLSPEAIFRLRKAGWDIQQIDLVSNPNGDHSWRFEYVYSKLHIFSMKRYSTVVYLDADTLLLKNVDELCSIPEVDFAGVARNEFVNAGVLVVSPSESVAQKLWDVYAHSPSYTGGDQGFLNYAFWNVNECPYFDPKVAQDESRSHQGRAKCFRLPSRYNGDVGLHALRGSSWILDPEGQETPSIVHFTLGPFKPWKWWSHPFLPEASEWWSVYSAHRSTPIIPLILYASFVGALWWLSRSDYLPPQPQKHKLLLYIMWHVLGLCVAWGAASISLVCPLVNCYIFLTILQCFSELARNHLQAQLFLWQYIPYACGVLLSTIAFNVESFAFTVMASSFLAGLYTHTFLMSCLLYRFALENSKVSSLYS